MQRGDHPALPGGRGRGRRPPPRPLTAGTGRTGRPSGSGSPADLRTDPAHPVLARVVRGGVVESVHRGSLVVLAPDGSALLRRGDPGAPVLPRSCLKPLQAAGLLRAGLAEVLRPGRDDDLLALAAASHSGEDRHVAGVRRLLGRVGLDEGALRNRPLLPLGEGAAAEVLRSGGGPSALRADCSGKHAAMLATAVVRGQPTEGYLDVQGPVQAAVRAEVERVTGGPVAAVTTDGCGAPLFAVPLDGLAGALAAAVRAPSGSAARWVVDAMRAHPGMVGGSGRAVTDLMRAVPGLVVKDGADGVAVAATADGGAVALKLDDGAARGRVPVLTAALRLLGVDGAALEPWLAEPVTGGEEVVGAVTAHLQPAE